MPRTRDRQPAEMETASIGSLLVCPACEISYRVEDAHECDPERLWRQHVARWNELSAAEQRARQGECREVGHILCDVPLAATRMCTRCCVYVATEEGN